MLLGKGQSVGLQALQGGAAHAAPDAVAAAAAAAAVELSDFTKELRYCCQTCPYVYKITKRVSSTFGISSGLNNA